MAYTKIIKVKSNLNLCLDYTSNPKKTERRSAEDLNRLQLAAIGNNLNQLTHIANATGRVSASQLDRAQSLLEDMWRCVRDSL